jgi:hypothetical protein
MTRALRENSAADKQPGRAVADRPHRGMWRRIVDRILRRTPPATFGGMTYEEFGEFAATNPPPQAWHEQDVKDLRGPKG